MGRVSLVVVEGALEIPVAFKLLDVAGLARDGANVIDKRGCGPFRKDAPRYNIAAANLPGQVFGLTDLDWHPCASGLIATKIKGPLHPRFLLRVAIRELESWLLADSVGMADFLGVSTAILPAEPDLLTDAKRVLVDLARRSKSRALRDDLVPEAGRAAIAGLGYRPRMEKFVEAHWSPDAAAVCSPSLRRAMAALAAARR